MSSALPDDNVLVEGNDDETSHVVGDVTLLLEIALWVASGLLAAVLLSRRGLALGVLAGVSSAVTFAARPPEQAP